MVEAKWGTGLLLFVLGALQCQGAPFHPMSEALASSSEGKDAPSEPSPEENYLYRPLSAYPMANQEGRFDYGLNSDLVHSGESDEVSKEDEKRSRNFLRFGRGPQNFLRFGRGGNPLQYSLAHLEPTEEEMKRSRNFLRFGRDKKRNMNFGGANDRNYIRYGRSIDNQVGELESDNLNDNAESSYQVKAKIQPQIPNNDNGEDQNTQNNTPKATSRGSIRSKRSVPSISSDIWLIPPTSLTWDSNLQDWIMGQHSQEGSSDGSLQKPSKRGQHRSFLRYGRDPLDLHFLRFGKRSPDEFDLREGEDGQERIAIRSGANKNFLRFG